LLKYLGNVLQELGKHPGAAACFEESLALCRREYGQEHRQTIIALNNYAFVLMNQQAWEKAERIFREVLGVQRRRHGDDSLTLNIVHNLALTLSKQQAFPEAEEYYREALEGRRRVLTNRHPFTLRSMHALASVLRKQKRLEEAEPLYREALETAETVWPEGHYLVEHFRRGLGVCLRSMQRYEEAEPLLLLSHERHEASLPEGHAYRTEGIESLADLYEAWGQPDRAEEWRAKLDTAHSGDS